MKLKTFFFATLVFHAHLAQADAVLIRQMGSSFEDYQSQMKSSTHRQSAADLLEQRLKRTELSIELQTKVNETVRKAAENPSEARSLFLELDRELSRDPRSAAIRSVQRLVLQRLQAAGLSSDEIKNRLRALDRADQGIETSWGRTDLSQSEWITRWQQLRNQEGGQDLVVFWNGVRVQDPQWIDPGLPAQWIFVSSLWRPRILNGTWAQIAGELSSPFTSWVTEDCRADRPETTLLLGASTEVVARAACQTSSDVGTAGLSTASVAPAPHSKRPWLWGALAIGAGVLALSLSGKKLQIQRN